MEHLFSKPIWVLGSKVPGVKCFDWINGELDNFSDCGTLIIDMRTLTKVELKLIKMGRLREIRNQIQDRFVAGGNIICIVSESIGEINDEAHYTILNNFWSPISFLQEKVKPGKGIETLGEFGFKTYVDEIQSWDVTINNFSEHLDRWFGGKSEIEYPAFLKTGNNSIIGVVIAVIGNKKRSGYFAFLPKIKDKDTAINKLLEIFEIFEETPSPEWAEQIELPGANDLKVKISSLDTDIERLQEEKHVKKSKLETLNHYKKLLYATDKELEKIVIESLKLIGFSNAREGRSPEKEDALFDFNMEDLDLAVIEVKGKQKGASLDDFRQLDDWAWDYRNDGKKVKPILIANCFRLDDPSNLQNRMNFEDHRDYFVQHKIAVLPTWTLFKLVEHKLAGNEIDVNRLQTIFSTTNDVLRPEDVIQ